MNLEEMTNEFGQKIGVVITVQRDLLRNNTLDKTRKTLQLIVGTGGGWSTVIVGGSKLSVFTEVFNGQQEFPVLVGSNLSPSLLSR